MKYTANWFLSKDKIPEHKLIKNKNHVTQCREEAYRHESPNNHNMYPRAKNVFTGLSSYKTEVMNQTINNFCHERPNYIESTLNPARAVLLADGPRQVPS